MSGIALTGLIAAARPASRNAKLVVNAAFALGDFLYDTYAYQRARRAAEAA